MLIFIDVLCRVIARWLDFLASGMIVAGLKIWNLWKTPQRFRLLSTAVDGDKWGNFLCLHVSHGILLQPSAL